MDIPDGMVSVEFVEFIFQEHIWSLTLSEGEGGFYVGRFSRVTVKKESVLIGS